MNTIGQLYRTKYTGKPEIMQIHPNNILSKPLEVFEFNTKDIQQESIRKITKNVQSECHKNGVVNGIALWFDVYFHAGDKPDIVLTTAPVMSPLQLTHWKQTVIILPFEKTVEKSEKLHYNLDISKSAKNPRHYNIELNVLDPDEQSAMSTSEDKSREEFHVHHNDDSEYDEYNSGSDDNN
ncbi:hypothetical protein M8J75_001690 [Diaphorina citri]|nr:hypothetical protein M8J75_001690 [Diaphorina citri]